MLLIFIYFDLAKEDILPTLQVTGNKRAFVSAVFEHISVTALAAGVCSHNTQHVATPAMFTPDQR